MRNLVKILALMICMITVRYSVQAQDCSHITLSKTEIKVPPEYLLTLALSYQAQAKMQEVSPDQRRNNHNQAISYFDSYIKCLQKNLRQPNLETYIRKSASHYRLADYDNALLAINEAVRFVPNRDAYLLKARIYIRKQQYIQAIRTIELVLPLYPDDMDMLLLAGSVNEQLKEHSQALVNFLALYEILQRKQGYSRYRADILRYLGDIYTRVGNSQKAIEKYKEYLQYRPRDIRAMLLYGRHLTVIGKLAEAEKQLHTIIRSYPGQSNALLMLLEIKLHTDKKNVVSFLQKQKKVSLPMAGLFSLIEEVYQGNLEDKEEGLKKYLKKQPLNLSIHFTLQELYERQKDWQKYKQQSMKLANLARSEKKFYMAIDIIQNLLKQKEAVLPKKDKLSVYTFLSSCYMQLQKPDRALQMVEEAAKYTESEDEIYKNNYQRAYLLRMTKIGQYEKSNRILQKLIKKKKDAEWQFLIAMNYYAMKDYKNALSYLNKAIQYAPEQAIYFFYRAHIYDKLKRSDKIISDLKRSIQLDKNYASPRNYLGFLYAEKNINKQEATRLILQAVEIEPDNIAYRDSLGWIYYKKKMYNRAFYHLYIAQLLMEENNDPDPVVLEHLGDVCLSLQKRTEAIHYWQKSLQFQKEKKQKQKIQKKINKIKQETPGPIIPKETMQAVENFYQKLVD